MGDNGCCGCVSVVWSESGRNDRVERYGVYP